MFVTGDVSWATQIGRRSQSRRNRESWVTHVRLRLKIQIGIIKRNKIESKSRSTEKRAWHGQKSDVALRCRRYESKIWKSEVAPTITRNCLEIVTHNHQAIILSNLRWLINSTDSAVWATAFEINFRARTRIKLSENAKWSDCYGQRFWN